MGMLNLLYLENNNFVYYFIICIAYVSLYFLFFFVSVDTYQLLLVVYQFKKNEVEIQS